MKFTVNGHFEDLNVSHHKLGIEVIEHRWEKNSKVKQEKDICLNFYVFFVRSGTFGTVLVVY